MGNPVDHSIQIDETAPGSFKLTVFFDGQRFECGSYLNRAEAMKAGRLFVERKQNEAVSQKKRPRKKG